MDAIEHEGAFKGLLKGCGRIIRCNPFLPGGHDPYVNIEKDENLVKGVK